jgi:hypothetical protein
MTYQIPMLNHSAFQIDKVAGQLSKLNGDNVMSILDAHWEEVVFAYVVHLVKYDSGLYTCDTGSSHTL